MELTEKSSVVESPSPTNTRWWQYPGIRFLILAAIAQIIVSTATSFLPAFFPSEANKKGASPIEFGLIMGTSALAMGLFSPPWGLVTARFSSKMQMVCSIFGVGIMTLIFGFVDWLPNGASYLAATFSLRLVIGLGLAIFETSTYTMLPVVMVGRESTGFAVLETSLGIGYLLGPAVGGALFDLGGYYMPFVVMTAPLFIIGIICLLFIEDPVIKRTTESISWKKFIFCPCTLLYSVILFSTEVDFGFLSVYLEPALSQFSLSHSAIGGVILCSALAYALTAPIFGHLCDKGVSAEYGAFAGSVLACPVFLFLGPIPWFPFDPSLWLITVTVICCGLAVTAKTIFSFKMLMNSALIICKFPDNVVTYAAVTSVFLLYICIGAFVGPFVGGVLQDYLGIRGGTIVMFFFELFLVLLQGVYLILNKFLSAAGKVISPHDSVARPENDYL